MLPPVKIKDIAEALYQDGVVSTKGGALTVVQAVVEEIRQRLLAGDTVDLRGVIEMRVEMSKARQGTDLRGGGGKVVIEPRRVVRTRVSKALRMQLASLPPL